jgi:hypothetical protein
MESILREIPSEVDWGDYKLDFEVEYAYQRFAGKTIEEVQSYFEGAVLSASEDIGNMPTIPFQYYILAFRLFLMDPKRFEQTSGSDQDGPNAFLTLLRRMLTESPARILPVMEFLIPVAHFVAAHQNEYGADESIYGSFPDIVSEIDQLYKDSLQ